MKKKSTLRFPLSRKGYDREAVDGFIALEQAKNDELQLEQRERINALKQENDALKLQVETLKGREEQIKSLSSPQPKMRTDFLRTSNSDTSKSSTGCAFSEPSGKTPTSR